MLLVFDQTHFSTMFFRYAAIAVASKLSDMQLGESVDIGQLTKKEQKKARFCLSSVNYTFVGISQVYV